MEEHTNLWRLLRRITEGVSKKVVMSIKDEDGFTAWQRLKQRFELGLAAQQGIVMAEFSGMVARLAKSPGETIALLTEMDRKMKLVEDGTGEEVSEMHARSVLVEILGPVTRQHTVMNHSKSHKALKKIAQQFPNNSTTSQETMQIGRVEAGATAPTTAWPPPAAETPEDSCEESCIGYGHVSQKCPNFGRGKGAYERSRATTTGTRAATSGCTRV